MSNSDGDLAQAFGRAFIRGIDDDPDTPIFPTISDGNEGLVNLQFGVGNAQLSYILEALESKGVVRTLAEPNLTALSGQEAKFLAGGEFPVPVAQEEGVITVKFKPFGVELNFIPREVDGDLINLTLEAAVSSIDPGNGVVAGGLAIDAFRRREATTTVEMRDGESFAIAGLLEDDFQDLNGQVLFGKTASTPRRGAAGEVAKQDFNGSYGYVMD